MILDTNILPLVLRKDGSVGLTADWNAGAYDIKALSFSIGANKLTTSEWAYLDGQDQSTSTGDTVTFATINAGEDIFALAGEIVGLEIGDGTALITGGAGTGFASLVVDNLTLDDSTIISDATSIRIDNTGTSFDLCTGDLINTVDDDQRGVKISHRTLGGITLDFKTYLTKTIDFRCGEGAEVGSTHTWMTVDPTEGNVDFPEIVSVGGLVLGDTEYAEFGVGNETGALGCDGRIYSDGSDLIIQVESPTGANADYTNPSLTVGYHNYTGAGAYIPRISSPRSSDVFMLDRILYVMDSSGDLDAQIFVADKASDTTGIIVTYNSDNNYGEINTTHGPLRLVPSTNLLINPTGTGVRIGSVVAPTKMLHVTGDAAIGDGTNDLLISSTGVVTMAGTARVYREIIIGAASWHKPTIGAPPDEAIVGLGQVLLFDKATDEHVHYQTIIPEDFAAGTEISIQVDWSYDTEEVDGYVVWEMNYLVVANGEDPAAAGTLTFQQSAITTADGDVSEDKVIHTTFATGITGAVADDILIVRFNRDANGTNAVDDLDQDARLHAVHLHFIKDKLGKALS